MTKAEFIEQQLADLPVEEQLRLAQSVLEKHMPAESYQLSPELRRIFRVRLADARANPEAGVRWSEAKASILDTL